GYLSQLRVFAAAFVMAFSFLFTGVANAQYQDEKPMPTLEHATMMLGDVAPFRDMIIEGTVSLENGEPMSNVRVEFWQGEHHTHTFYTDENGRYVAEGLDREATEIRAGVKGLMEDQDRIEPGWQSRHTVNFTLRVPWQPDFVAEMEADEGVTETEAAEFVRGQMIEILEPVVLGNVAVAKDGKTSCWAPGNEKAVSESLQNIKDVKAPDNRHMVGTVAVINPELPETSDPVIISPEPAPGIEGDARSGGGAENAESSQSIQGFDVQMGPNPASHHLGIRVSHAALRGPMELQILDNHGRIMHRETVQMQGNFEKEFELTGWAAGIYFVKGKVGEVEFVKKFVKI
ncbi:MAG: carboxypeptidase regulatory-like domain-containing protein, partial [Bacteroidota bacterium]